MGREPTERAAKNQIPTFFFQEGGERETKREGGERESGFWDIEGILIFLLLKNHFSKISLEI